MSRVGNSIGRQHISGCPGLGEEQEELGDRGIFEGDENVLQLTVMMVAPLVSILNTTKLYTLCEWYDI